jgi:hypothetical protein
VGKSEDASCAISLDQADNTRAIILLSLTATIWIGMLLLESTRPAADVLGLFPQIDKIAHFGAFSILGLLVCRLSLAIWPRPGIALFSLPLLVVTLCGIIEEGIQMFVPGRMASIPDLLADVCGALFAILLTNLLQMHGKGRLAA